MTPNAETISSSILDNEPISIVINKRKTSTGRFLVEYFENMRKKFSLGKSHDDYDNRSKIAIEDLLKNWQNNTSK